MRIVLTGVAGFIAAKVAEQLLADGHSVVGIDNLNDAYDVRLKTWRLGRLEGRHGFRFHNLDIEDREAVRAAFSSYSTPDLRPEAVINLAARAGVRYSVENPWVYFSTNVVGTLNMLEACREFGVGKFVLASTSSLYGDHNPMPFREDADTSRPLSPYAASKKAAESLLYAYHHLHGVDVSVLRYFTVYGPAGRPDMSPFRFVQWISEERPLVLYGDGTQRRDFTFVDDIARGTIAALKPLGFEIVNLGSDEPIVLNDAIRLMEEMVGKKARIVSKPKHAADMQATWADIGKAQRLLNWRPRTSFAEGVAALVAWYKENRTWAREIGVEERQPDKLAKAA